MDRTEIDARQHRCEQARLHPTQTVTIVDYKPTHLLSHAEAQSAGLAMHDRWVTAGEGIPPLSRDDTAWADMARAAWEAVWAFRRDG
jgi:hypothetical protein